MLERREKLRAKVAIPGYAAFPGVALETRCLIVDLSGAGACLSFATGLPVPRLFSLRFGSNPKAHEVRVAWKRNSDVGVAFLTPRVDVPDVLPD
jgi:hypothetical protein